MPNMRAIFIVSLLAFSCPALALAQSPPTPAAAPAPKTSSPAPAKGGDITRDEYVQRAVDRAKKAAETRFNKLDVNHDGVLTADERRAARAAKKSSQ
jgi:hypothetical protein